MIERAGLPRVLVVEDDPALLRLLVRYLQRAGMEADGAESAVLAIERFEPGAYSTVLADLTLPDGSGLELIETFLRSDSQLRAVLFSGYPLDLDMLPGSVRERASVLQKPFSPPELLLLLQP